MDLQKLVEQYLETKDQTTLNQIVKMVEPLIKGRSRQLSHIVREEHSDMSQELFIVLLKRLASYDKTKSKFITYLINTLRGDPTGILAGKVCKKRGGDGLKKYADTPLSLDQFLNEGSEDKYISLVDQLEDKNSLRDKIEQEDIEELINKYGEEKAAQILKEELI